LLKEKKRTEEASGIKDKENSSERRDFDSSLDPRQRKGIELEAGKKMRQFKKATLLGKGWGKNELTNPLKKKRRAT